ncbi:hypothetical protein CE91St44_27270 [Oscillospiraceae bacterium]|nr:hypothetical protein CE91St44_27270 [Oscillospiraceae bacterium]
MAYIKNSDGNLKLEIEFLSNDMLNYNPQKSNCENWIPFTLGLFLPKRHKKIEEAAKATMTVYEIQEFLQKLEEALEQLNRQNHFSNSFCSSEAFFEIKLETLPEDSVVEIEVWINVGNQTKGEIYGYDEGVRFVCGTKELFEFIAQLKNDFSDIINSVISKTQK